MPTARNEKLLELLKESIFIDRNKLKGSIDIYTETGQRIVFQAYGSDIEVTIHESKRERDTENPG